MSTLDQLNQRLAQIAEGALKRALEKGLAAARARMTAGGGGPRVRSGRLRDSLRAKVTREGNLLRGELSAGAPYAMVQEKGAVIQAKRAKYLRFKVQGRWVSKKQVTIPPRPYLRPGMESALEAFRQEFHEALAKEFS